MFKNWKSVSVTTALSATLLLAATTVPSVANLNTNKDTTHTHALAKAPVQNTLATEAPKSGELATGSQKQKSVFDDDALQSPFSFLKDTSGTHEGNNDITAASSTVVLALKALAATLLSTIM